MKVRVASAGTGKTTSLVLRYLDCIASGLPLRRIAGVTFTRASADELRQRVGLAIEELLSSGQYLDVSLRKEHTSLFEEAFRELDGASLSTIHGFMIASLRLVAPMMGLDPDFSILGEWEARAMFEEELNSLLYLASQPEHGLYPAQRVLGKQAFGLVSQLFALRSLTENFLLDEEPSHKALHALYEGAYRKFEVRLGASLLPPSEVERRALKLTRNPQALERLASRFKLILIDEFQDVNPLQGSYFEALERNNMTIEVVGDPKQSIYGFRNADVEVFRRALAKGEVLEPLQHTRRHTPLIARFLNHLTMSLGKENLGFSQEEAPLVESKGAQAQGKGLIELHWILGDKSIADLRRSEAKCLVERLKALNAKGYAYKDMAVLARSYAGLAQVEDALLAADVPYVLLQGRGYYDRLEIRDLYHALHMGIDAAGFSLGVWLRGPFAQLDLAQVDRVLSAEEPLNYLQVEFPKVFERLSLIQAQVRSTPLEALKFLIREPFIEGKPYVDYLHSRARENVDALLFTVAKEPPGDIEMLLDRLHLLSQQTDAGDVPQSGEGIQLLTIHKAKGLEWPVVAVFDLGRMNPPNKEGLLVHPQSGQIYLKDKEGFKEARERIVQRNVAESYRLLYVAASRPRDVLIMTGSVKNNKPTGWVKALELMNLGPSAQTYQRPDFILQTHAYEPVIAKGLRKQSPGLDAAPWIDKTYAPEPHPPVSSPSRVKAEVLHEPLPFSDPEEGERLPGWASTVGTLTHYAISQNWQSDNDKHMDNLRSQEVMFPFSLEEQADILTEVRQLLHNYEHLLGKDIPTVLERHEDYPELPMALPIGTTVWQGIIDRLYRVGDTWYLEDYKTDKNIKPELYHFQLAVYLKAIQDIKGITPQVQLVYLRAKKVIVVPKDVAERALHGQLPEAVLA